MEGITIIMESYIDDFIRPEGYLPWNGTMNLDTCYFSEYANSGRGSATDKRVKWACGLLTKDQATGYTGEVWVQASTWLPQTGIPFDSGLIIENTSTS